MRRKLKVIVSLVKQLLESVYHVILIIAFASLKHIFVLRRQRKGDGENLLVLGNGPSLAEALESSIARLAANYSGIIAVNTFACSKFYEQTQPDQYIIVDPLFFADVIHSPRAEKAVSELVQCLIERTKWEVSLYIPRYYSRSSFAKSLSEHPWIHVCPINNVPLSGGFDFLKLAMFRAGLGNPPFQNVLVAAVFVGLELGYSAIDIVGADHTWLNALSVDDENRVILEDAHSDSSETHALVDLDNRPKALHTFLCQLSIMFEQYHILQNFAANRGVAIRNLTPNSFIDAFDREAPRS